MIATNAAPNPPDLRPTAPASPGETVEVGDGEDEVKVPLPLPLPLSLPLPDPEPEPEPLLGEAEEEGNEERVVEIEGVTVADCSSESCELAIPPGLPPDRPVDSESGTVVVSESEPEFVSVAEGEEVVLVSVGLLVSLVVVAAGAEDDEEEDEGSLSTSSQLRSKRGVVESVLPTMPKLGLGVSGDASWRVYHLRKR